MFCVISNLFIVWSGFKRIKSEQKKGESKLFTAPAAGGKVSRLKEDMKINEF